MNVLQPPLTIANAADLGGGSPATKATRAAWQHAATQHAAACANLAATLARQLWPTAGLLVFDVASNESGDVETELQMIFELAEDGPEGPLIWSASRVAAGTAAELDHDTDRAITLALAEAVEADPDFFDWSDHRIPGCENLQRLAVGDAAALVAHAPVMRLKPAGERTGLRWFVGCVCGWEPVRKAGRVSTSLRAFIDHARENGLDPADLPEPVYGEGYPAAGMTYEGWNRENLMRDPFTGGSLI